MAALRIGGLLYEDTRVDRYGRKEERPGENDVDPHDVGEAARPALELPDLTWETLYVMGVRGAARNYDLSYTERRLGWQPVHRFGT